MSNQKKYTHPNFLGINRNPFTGRRIRNQYK